MLILTRDELMQAIRDDHNNVNAIYHDITTPDRYVLGFDAENWRSEGSDYDSMFGGDWMPAGAIATMKIAEEALYGTYCGEPV